MKHSQESARGRGRGRRRSVRIFHRIFLGSSWGRWRRSLGMDMKAAMAFRISRLIGMAAGSSRRDAGSFSGRPASVARWCLGMAFAIGGAGVPGRVLPARSF